MILRNSRIFLGQAFTSPISLEIINESRRILAQVSKVNCLAAFFKKEHTVKYLEQLSGRLMNPEGEHESEIVIDEI